MKSARTKEALEQKLNRILEDVPVHESWEDEETLKEYLKTFEMFKKEKERYKKWLTTNTK